MPIDVFGSSTAIAVGVTGSVVKTTDAGVTWNVQPTIAGLPYLYGVSIIDAAAVVAVGRDGAIYRSLDGGATWSPRASGTSESLYDVDFADPTFGIAVGRNGTILFSADGGVTWVVSSSPTTAILNSVKTISAAQATAVGNGGTILNYDGVSWQAVSSPTGADLTDVDFADPSTGIIVGFGPTALGTTDGGQSWNVQTVPSPPGTTWLRGVSMADNLHAFASGKNTPPMGPDQGVLMRTSTGGATWDWVTEPGHLYRVGSFSSSEAVAVGTAGLIRRTSDGGVTWPQVGGGVEVRFMQGVDFFDAQNGVAVSTDIGYYEVNQSSTAYVTADGGDSWTLVDFFWYILHDVAYADATTVYASGSGPASMDVGSVIWRSTDGGMTWSNVYQTVCAPDGSGCDEYFRSANAINFADPSAGVAVGTEGAIVSIQGGVATRVPSPTIEELYGVSMPTVDVAWAVGNNGAIVKGTSGGTSWAAQTSGTTEPLLDVCFTDELTGTAVGLSGTILRTTDGGATWNPQVSGVTLGLNSVSFIDALRGVAGGATTLLKTRDGGSTWVPEETPSELVDVDFVDVTTVFAAGWYENIIARLDLPVPVYFADFAATTASGYVALHWSVSYDEVVRGYQLYRSDAGGPEVTIDDRLIDPSARSFIDRDVEEGNTYRYTLAAVHLDGSETRSQAVTVTMPQRGVTLFQNHPNPFNPSTTIRFSLPERMSVRLAVYDVAGRRVVTLVDGIRTDGVSTVNWNGRNEAGEPVVSGVYFYRLITRDVTRTRKMVMLQ
jgi:photosystem II stability/assembly factor-like uncharacterized protein